MTALNVGEEETDVFLLSLFACGRGPLEQWPLTNTLPWHLLSSKYITCTQRFVGLNYLKSSSSAYHRSFCNGPKAVDENIAGDVHRWS